MSENKIGGIPVINKEKKLKESSQIGICDLKKDLKKEDFGSNDLKKFSYS